MTDPNALYRWVAALLLLAVAIIGCLVLLSGCAPDPYAPPPVHAGQVIWRMVPADQVPAACKHPEAKWIEGCAMGLEIITRIPERGDGELVDILHHEVAHTQGWRHPPHPDGTP